MQTEARYDEIAGRYVLHACSVRPSVVRLADLGVDDPPILFAIRAGRVR